jgi:hypothetical protein
MATEPRQEPQVYKTEAGQWRCVDCSMWGGRESYPAKSCGDMLEHLEKHALLGEEPPEREVRLLLGEFWEAHRGQPT